jgi:hypothetical protein
LWWPSQCATPDRPAFDIDIDNNEHHFDGAPPRPGKKKTAPPEAGAEAP